MVPHILLYKIVWVSMEIVYSIFIGIFSSKIVGMIDGIVLQCRRDRSGRWRQRQPPVRAKKNDMKLVNQF
jgi:hypothetical protein